MMQSRHILTEDEQHQARQAFRLGLDYLAKGRKGNVKALNDAIIYLTVALEWALPDTWLNLWMETRMALNEAVYLRGNTSLYLMSSEQDEEA